MESDFELDYEEPDFDPSPTRPPPREPTLEDVQQELTAAEPQIEEQEFEVDKVLDVRMNEATGTIEYLLSWKEWAGDPTWEPEDQCDCEDLIVEFTENKKRLQNEERILAEKARSPPRKKRAHGPISQKTISRVRTPEVITLSSSSDDDSAGANTCRDLVPINDFDGDNNRPNVDHNASSSPFEQKPLFDRDAVERIERRSSSLHERNLNSKSKTITPPPLLLPPPPPPQNETRLNLEQGYKALLDRRLNLDRIVGTTDHPEKCVIVKWQNISNYEKVPFDIFRTFWPQELLDYFIDHIEFED